MQHIRRLVVSILLFTSTPLYSAPLTPAERNDAQQRQATVIEQAQRQREDHSQLHPAGLSAPAQQTSQTGPCFPIHDIAFIEGTLLGHRDQARLRARYINRCLNVNDINQLIHDVSNWYIARGFITSRAYLREQDLSSGRLQIILLEGRIEAITLKEEKRSD